MLRTVVAGAVTVVLAAPTAPAAAGCRHADRPARESEAAAIARSVRCLINHRRERHGAGTVRRDHRLARAARRHTADMVAHNDFAHTSRDGATPADRIRHAVTIAAEFGRVR